MSNDVAYLSLCRGDACSQDMRQSLVKKHANGYNDNVVIRELQQQHKHPHPDAVRKIIIDKLILDTLEPSEEPEIVGQYPKD